MSDILVTFPGKYGDALWALPTVKAISELTGQKVDYYLMPYYENLVPLLAYQEYIDTAGVLPEWVRTHSNFGDQPWKPQRITKEYKQAWHLGYRAHPGITAPDLSLIDFIAYQQGIQLKQPIVPFLEVDHDIDGLAKLTTFATGTFDHVVRQNRLVAVAFNEQYGLTKEMFFRALWLEMKDTGIEFFNITRTNWKEAALIIKCSLAFVGDRSACWVMATGMGQKAITFEPHPARHKSGTLGRVFGCPYGEELTLPFGLPTEECAKVAKSLIMKIKETEDAKYDDINLPLATV